MCIPLSGYWACYNAGSHSLIGESSSHVFALATVGRLSQTGLLVQSTAYWYGNAIVG